MSSATRRQIELRSLIFRRAEAAVLGHQGTCARVITTLWFALPSEDLANSGDVLTTTYRRVLWIPRAGQNRRQGDHDQPESGQVRDLGEAWQRGRKEAE